MTMNLAQLKEEEQNYVMQTYGRVDAAPIKGRNATAWDEAGKQYIDFTSGIGVNALGYSDPQWVQAVTAQLGEIQHLSNYYYHPNFIALAKALSDLSGLSRSFFCNSGAEANECAVKVARKFGADTGRSTLITLENSFHGRTLTTLAATGQDSFHQEFQPLTPGFRYAVPNDLESLKAQYDDSVCGVMIEMVQGEGGVNPLDPDYVKALRAFCTAQNMLLLVDEVQTGIGRTGQFFGYQKAGILPDVVTCAKGLGNGLPIGVCMVAQTWKDLLKPGMQGSTFGGNPVVCAGALEVVRRVSDPMFLAAVREKALQFRQALRQMPEVLSVHGEGLMLGISLVPGLVPVAVLKACAQAGLLVLTAKDRVRFLPPLTISAQEIETGLRIFRQVLREQLSC